MAAEYQETDARVVDYEAFCLDAAISDPSRDQPLRIRGPRPARLDPGDYFVCLGAAQTFGRFCARPFPILLQERLSLPALNISHGGAGPSFFCGENERLLHYLNNARFVVLQVMSGRSESNSRFESRGVGHYTRRSDGVQLSSDAAFEMLLRSEPRSVVAEIVRETRVNWLAAYQSLLAQLATPVVLFWFAPRRPGYRESYESVSGLFGGYPQLVNAAMLQALRSQCEGFAMCVSRRGLPQPLVDRTSGAPVVIADPWTAAPWEQNWYYPSPEMHADAAAALERPCRKVAGLWPAASPRWSMLRRA